MRIIIINKQSVIELATDGSAATLACFVHCADNVDVKRGMIMLQNKNRGQFGRDNGQWRWILSARSTAGDDLRPGDITRTTRGGGKATMIPLTHFNQLPPDEAARLLAVRGD
jgi:hypothetical protein